MTHVIYPLMLWKKQEDQIILKKRFLVKKKTANKKLLAIVNFFRLSIIYFSSDNTPHKCIYI